MSNIHHSAQLHYIQSVYNDLVLTVDPTDEEVLVQEKEDTEKPYQLWKINVTGCITSAFNNKVLDFENHHVETSSKIILKEQSNNNLFQKWLFTPDGHLKSRVNGFCIDIFDADKAAGSEIMTWAERPHNWQKWRLLSVEGAANRNDSELTTLASLPESLKNHFHAESAKIMWEMGCFTEKQISTALEKTNNLESAVLFLTDDPMSESEGEATSQSPERKKHKTDHKQCEMPISLQKHKSAQTAKIIWEMGGFTEDQIKNALERTNSLESAILFLTDNPNSDSEGEATATAQKAENTNKFKQMQGTVHGFENRNEQDETQTEGQKKDQKQSKMPESLQNHSNAQTAKTIWEMGCFSERQILNGLKRTSSIGGAVLFMSGNSEGSLHEKTKAEESSALKDPESIRNGDSESLPQTKLNSDSEKPTEKEGYENLTSLLTDVAPHLKLTKTAVEYIGSRFKDDLNAAVDFVLNGKNESFLKDLCHDDGQKELLLKYQSIEPRPLVKKLLAYAIDSNIIHGRNAECIIDAVNQCHSKEELVEFIEKTEERLEDLQKLLAQQKSSFKQSLYEDVVKQNLHRKFSADQLIYALSVSNTIEEVVATLGKQEASPDIPETWTAPGPQDDPLVQLVPLSPQSAEYAKVMTMFQKSQPNTGGAGFGGPAFAGGLFGGQPQTFVFGPNNQQGGFAFGFGNPNYQQGGFGFGGTNFPVPTSSKKKKKRKQNAQYKNSGEVAIYRVQNRTLWRVYCNTARLISEKPINQGCKNEKYLFRGERTPGVVDSVVRIGFDVMWAANCTPKGIWLSDTSSYSVNYCAADPATGRRRMIMVKCALGTVGQDDGTNRPDVVAGSNPPQRADCHHCGDNRYVVYNNAQLYPEYIIEF